MKLMILLILLLLTFLECLEKTILSRVSFLNLDSPVKINGGYYTDAEAEFQAFHICIADGAGGLAIYSFLCPNLVVQLGLLHC